MIEKDDIELDDDFDALLADKRHRDMMLVLNKLSSALNGKNQSIDLQPFVNQNKELVNGFISKLQDLAKPQAAQTPQVNVNVNQEKVISSLTEMTKTITTSLKSFEDVINEFNNKKPVAYEVTITERNYSGFAQKITIKPKL